MFAKYEAVGNPLGAKKEILANREAKDGTVGTRKRNSCKIVDQQKEVIDDRTKKLKEKNKELAEISQLNAHTVREPLSRILGLIEISDYYSAEELKTEVLDHLKTSSEDLDKALKDVIERSAKAIELFSSKSPQ